MLQCYILEFKMIGVNYNINTGITLLLPIILIDNS